MKKSINNVQRYNHKLSSIFECYLEMKRILKKVRITFPLILRYMINHVGARFDPRRAMLVARINVRVKPRSLALQDIFETSDRDIKKERATSCPAGGHWRGINHPREGLHFNARGWISNARAQAARSRARQPALGSRRCIRCNRPAVLCSARAYLVRCSGYRRRASLRYRCNGRRIRRARAVGAGRHRRQRKSSSPSIRDWRNSPLFFRSLVFFFHSALMYVTGFHGYQSLR